MKSVIVTARCVKNKCGDGIIIWGRTLQNHTMKGIPVDRQIFKMPALNVLKLNQNVIYMHDGCPQAMHDGHGNPQVAQYLDNVSPVNWIRLSGTQKWSA